MLDEFGKWPEVKWVAADLDSKKTGPLTAGVDVGSVSSKAAVMCAGEPLSYAVIRTGVNSGASADKAMARALEGTGIQLGDIRNIVGTGVGRKNISFARQAMNEIICHVRGAAFMYGPTMRTIIDMGGQSTRAIRCDGRARIVEFFVNDKCASGMGRDTEMMADLLHVPIQNMGDISLSVKEEPEPVSTTCSVYASPQAIAMLRAGSKEDKVLAAYLFAIAFRIYTTAGRLNLEKDLVFTGGLAKNAGVTRRVERELGMTALAPRYDTQVAGALGAALLAAEMLEPPKVATDKVYSGKNTVDLFRH